MSIAQSILEIIADTLNGEEGGRVEKVGVRVGKLVAVVPDSLAFCFSAITAGTPLDGAVLAIEEIPIQIRCNGCAATSEVEAFLFRCPECGSGDVRVLSGNELAVSYIEVE